MEHTILNNVYFLQDSKAVVPLQLDAAGKVKYDAIARMGQRKDKVVHSSLQAMVAQERPTEPELMKPDEEEISKVSMTLKISMEWEVVGITSELLLQQAVPTSRSVNLPVLVDWKFCY